MSSDKEKTIGIILPNITNHFSANFFSQITDALAKEGFRTIVSDRKKVVEGKNVDFGGRRFI